MGREVKEAPCNARSVADQASTITVLIVEDHGIVAEGLERCLRLAAWVQVIGWAPTLAEATALCEHLSPDVVLLDLRLPDSEGLATIRAIRQICPAAQVIVLTGAGPGLEPAARELGVAAYLGKEVGCQALLRTIAELFPALANQPATSALTQRETEVATLAVKGLSNHEIARALFISENTVKTHVANVLRKLDLAGRVDLARHWSSVT